MILRTVMDVSMLIIQNSATGRAKKLGFSDYIHLPSIKNYFNIVMLD